jgi:hypothetical protein
MVMMVLMNSLPLVPPCFSHLIVVIYVVLVIILSLYFIKTCACFPCGCVVCACAVALFIYFFFYFFFLSHSLCLFLGTCVDTTTYRAARGEEEEALLVDLESKTHTTY